MDTNQQLLFATNEFGFPTLSIDLSTLQASSMVWPFKVVVGDAALSTAVDQMGNTIKFGAFSLYISEFLGPEISSLLFNSCIV